MGGLSYGGNHVITLPSKIKVLQLTLGFYREMDRERSGFFIDCCIASDPGDFVLKATIMASSLSLQKAFSDRIVGRQDLIFSAEKTIQEWELFIKSSVGMYVDVDPCTSPRLDAFALPIELQQLDGTVASVLFRVGRGQAGVFRAPV